MITAADLKTGFTFYSIWFTGIVRVKHVLDDGKNMIVEINDNWEESWNVQHTLWGFEKGEYSTQPFKKN